MHVLSLEPVYYDPFNVKRPSICILFLDSILYMYSAADGDEVDGRVLHVVQTEIRCQLSQ